MQDGSSKGPIIIPIVGDRGFIGDPGPSGPRVQTMCDSAHTRIEFYISFSLAPGSLPSLWIEIFTQGGGGEPVQGYITQGLIP